MGSFFARNYEIAAGSIAAAFMLFGFFVLKLPLWLTLTVTGLLFLGLFFLGSSWMEIQIGRQAQNMTTDQLREKLKDGLQKVSSIRGWAGSIRDEEVRRKVLGLAELADRILREFAHKPPDPPGQVGRFALYLEKFLPVVERYARLSSSPEGREMLMKTTHDPEFWELLHTAEDNFTRAFQDYLADNAMELRAFGRNLNKMMLDPKLDEPKQTLDNLE